MHSPRIFALADGRTERVFLDDNKFQNTLKENQFCTMVDALKKKQTITSGCVIRLGKLPFVLFAQMMFFSRFFFPYSWNGQWNDRPLGSCDMNSPLEKLVRGELIKMPLRLKFALCVSANIVLFSIAGPFAGLQ